MEDNLVNTNKYHKLCNNNYSIYDTILTSDSNNPPPPQVAIADTGSSGHYINPSTFCMSKQENTSGPTITLPNGKTLNATHSSHLAFPSSFSPTSTLPHTYASLKKPLISIGQLCNDDKFAIFTKTHCYILDTANFPISVETAKDNALITGQRDNNTRLWTINTNQLHSTPNTLTNSVYQLRKIKDIIAFHHQSLFIPVKSSWIEAINNGNFNSWPSLTP